MECCYWLVGWLVGGDGGEKRDPESYMIPEDDVAEVCEVCEVGEVGYWSPHDVSL